MPKVTMEKIDQFVDSLQKLGYANATNLNVPIVMKGENFLNNHFFLETDFFLSKIILFCFFKGQ